MIKALCAGVALLLCSVAAAQDSLEEIMERGIAFHEEGKYELSLIEYKKALAMEPKNAWVNYELGLSYYYLGNAAKAKKHAEVAAREKSEHGLQAVILLGTILDEEGEEKRSVKVYKKGIKQYGDYYLLWFNLGVTANAMGDYELAQEAFEKAVGNKLDHASSHYALASIKMIQGRRPDAMLPLYFFLLLEPTSERSQHACSDLMELWNQGITVNNDTSISLTVNPPEKGEEEGMQSADFYITILAASGTLEQNTGKSEFDLFRDHSKDFFNYLVNIDYGSRDDFWTRYYIPFFIRLGQSEHMDAFVHYISQSSNEESRHWVDKHTDELEEMFNWLDEAE